MASGISKGVAAVPHKHLSDCRTSKCVRLKKGTRYYRATGCRVTSTKQKFDTLRACSISKILDFSRRLTIVVKRSCCELVHQEWLTTARSHTVASCDERGLACATHTDVVYIHICGHVSAGSGHGFRIFPWPNNRCCSGANGRLPSRLWHPSQQ